MNRDAAPPLTSQNVELQVGASAVQSSSTLLSAVAGRSVRPAAPNLLPRAGRSTRSTFGITAAWAPKSGQIGVCLVDGGRGGDGPHRVGVVDRVLGSDHGKMIFAFLALSGGEC